MIPLFVTNLLEDKKIPLYGDGKNVRDWIYVLDNCTALDMVLHKGEIGEIYNIDAGNEKENLEVVQIILQLLHQSEEMIEYVNDRLGHDRRYSIDCTKIQRLGWHPQSNFKESLEETIRWYQKNTTWWKRLKKIKD